VSRSSSRSVSASSASAHSEAAFAFDRVAAERRLAASLWAEAELADTERDDERLTALLDRIKRYDSERAARWNRPGRIALTLDRPARIALHVFRCFRESSDCVPGGRGPTIAGGFEAAPVLVRDAVQLDEELAPGSYVAVITTSDDQIVRAPFVIARDERVAQSVALSALAGIPPGFVLVPAGDFLYGSHRQEDERKNMLAQPRHRVHGHAFWIARTEVTFGDWIAFLRALSTDERKRHLPSGPGVSLAEGPDGKFVLTLEPSPGEIHRAVEGEPLGYPLRKLRQTMRWDRVPVSGIAYRDALAYTAWLDRSGRVPGARICTAREWEHAARGADGRLYPHGDVLHPSDANFDETYGRKPAAYGPDEVGSFPASNSPYDIADLCGNLWEMTIVRDDKTFYRGGSFYQTGFSATAENMGNPGDPNLQNIRIGLRICADAARAR